MSKLTCICKFGFKHVLFLGMENFKCSFTRQHKKDCLDMCIL